MITKRAADNLGHIDQIMRRVQSCDWNPFKLNEIVTLERCLQECSVSDPQFNVILRKLDNESVFVEPSKRLKHLNRSKQEEQDDIEHKRMSLELREKVDKMNDDIWFYKWKLDDLIENENEMRSKILQLEKSFISLDRVCTLLTDELSLLLQRVYDSFECSLAIIKDQIPEYMRAIGKSKLIQQTSAIHLLYRRCLLKLIKQQRKACDDSTTIVYNFKKLANSHYNDYLCALVNLYRDLAMIDKLYSGEIPAELDHIRTLEQHTRYLEAPIGRPIRKITYGPDGGCGGVPLSPMGQLRTTGQQCDPELAKMLGSIARLLK
jgi:hypothetical protein